jgi:tetratricopeptide (TPR) repeat protein
MRIIRAALRAATANGLQEAQKKRFSLDFDLKRSDGSSDTLDRIRKEKFDDIKDAALVDQAMANIALEVGAVKYAVRLYEKNGDAEGVKRANLLLADASLSWMKNPGSYDYWADGSIKLYAAALGSEAAAWKHLGDKLLAAGQKRNAADAYKKAGQPDLAKPLIPGAAAEYLAKKEYEEAAALYKEAGMIEEARGALTTWVREKDSRSFWNGDTEKEKAKTLFRSYWDTKKDALLALAGIAEEAERYDDAPSWPKRRGTRPPPRASVRRNLGMH